MEPTWLTSAEAAAYLRIAPRTLRRWVQLGRVKQYKPEGVQAPLFKREDLDAVMKGAD
jgi:excisionase family DNA binding protein